MSLITRSSYRDFINNCIHAIWSTSLHVNIKYLAQTGVLYITVNIYCLVTFPECNQMLIESVPRAVSRTVFRISPPSIAITSSRLLSISLACSGTNLKARYSPDLFKLSSYPICLNPSEYTGWSTKEAAMDSTLRIQSDH